MKKVIAAAVVAVLLVGSSAIGQITEGQNWSLGLTNSMSLAGGPSDAFVIQGIGTLSVQGLGINPDTNGDPTVTAAQGIGAALFQTGTASTGGAAVGLVQSLAIVGAGSGPGQVQAVSDLSGPAQEVQGVSVTGVQQLTKGIGSNASLDGLNLTAFGMGQTMENNCAQGGQLSVILGGQYAEIDGAAQAVANVVTGMSATVVQVQAANTPATAP